MLDELLASYTETTAGSVPCDVSLRTDMTFEEFQSRLNALAQQRGSYDADGAVAVCLADGLTISTHCASEGSRLVAPGNGFWIMSPVGRATIANMRTDAEPATLEAQGALWVAVCVDCAVAGLSLTATGESGIGLQIRNSRVPFIRNLEINAHRTSGRALSFPVEDETAWVGEITNSRS
jgi:hypothetical protein